MLIKALCNYYDVLAAENKLLKNGYSHVDVSYLVSLTPKGEISDITDWQIEEKQIVKSGKEKIIRKPRTVVMPKRVETTKVCANIAEHRPLYIFGLNRDADALSTDDSKGKTKKSHADFVKRNLEFIDGIDSPVVNAYRAFIENWIPENETENPYLKKISKYNNSYFAFCLDGNPDVLLHEDNLLLKKWDMTFSTLSAEDKNARCAQCAVSGKVEPIAELHDKVKGLNSTGSVFIGHKTTSGCSYGNIRAYNSNISVSAMKKYTEAFNFLLGSKNHHDRIDDIHILYWADGGSEKEPCSDLLSLVMFGKKDDKLDERQTDDMLKTIIAGAKSGKAVNALAQKSAFDKIDPNVDFYIVGLKPNSSRIAVKFIYRKKFGDILTNIAKHQNDMQIGDEIIPISIWQIRRELTSPKSKSQSPDASLLSSIFKAIIYGTVYPDFLLYMVVYRLKTDVGAGDNGPNDPNNRIRRRIRTGIIKACLNRKSKLLNKNKEEIKLSLDLTNKNQAYLCGRLFAVLEKLQQSASNNSLNRTVKDAYFASAASKPTLVFPKLIRLAQNHLKKLSENSRIFYNKLIQEIICDIDGKFPSTLSLDDQGKFMVGYYQQYQSFFTNKNSEDNIKED